MSDCLFCGIVAGEVPAKVVHQTDLTYAFRDINPTAPVHVLVVPREHITDASSLGTEHGQLMTALITSAQEVARIEGIDGPNRGYRLVLNVGPEAQNSVPHLHLHVIGGRQMRWPPG